LALFGFISDIAINPLVMTQSILMLEHDEDDRYITESVFGEHRFDVKIHFVTSSDDFFQYLSSRLKERAPLPSLILLNYHAKPTNAVDVLKQLKSNPTLKQIPVVILSGSVKQEIIEECYANGASSFIQKPWKAGETEEKISNFFRYWFETVVLP
jgi:CheY-like chemotaxis protein